MLRDKRVGGRAERVRTAVYENPDAATKDIINLVAIRGWGRTNQQEISIARARIRAGWTPSSDGDPEPETPGTTIPVQKEPNFSEMGVEEIVKRVAEIEATRATLEAWAVAGRNEIRTRLEQINAAIGNRQPAGE
jgi:hypothetical protein